MVKGRFVPRSCLWYVRQTLDLYQVTFEVIRFLKQVDEDSCVEELFNAHSFRPE